MHVRSWIALGIFVAAPAALRGADIHVNPGQSIQAAINSAQAGDRVLVHPGTYLEAILLAKDVEVQGIGGAAVTVIDATGKNASVVTIVGSHVAPVKLVGLTLTGGSGNWSSSGQFGGGGVTFSGAYFDVIRIESCVITNNHVGNGFGGGVLVETFPSALVLADCTIDGNSAFRGGGVYGAANFESCVVSNNVAQDNGGGAAFTGQIRETTFDSNSALNGGGLYSAPLIHTFWSSATLMHDVIQARFVNNVATNIGGGAYVITSVSGIFESPIDAYLHQCLFRGNSANIGGGVYVDAYSAQPWLANTFGIANCVFSHNVAATGDGAYVNPLPAASLGVGIQASSFDGDGVGGKIGAVTSSIFRNVVNPFASVVTGTPLVSFSNVQGWPLTNGNIDADPLWISPAADEYGLSSASPCIDAGLTPVPAWTLPPIDYDMTGSPRIQHGAVDMGAEEFDVDCDLDGIPDYFEILSGTATDCDADGLPDNCQPLIDCNGNGVQDRCDIKTGAALDCNNNKIPDSCEALADCDDDGISNACAIKSFGEKDCNANGVPDSCDLANGTSADIDGDGVPDSCQNFRAVPSQYPTLQAAIDAAINGDTLIVADGIYTGAGNRLLDFKGKSILVTSANGPAHCVLDGEGVWRLASVDGATDVARLRGITWRRGIATNGGAILVTNGASATIEQCVFIANTATNGGALAVQTSGTAKVVGCTFVDNSASTLGGAAFVINSGASLTLDHCSFVGNSVTGINGAGGAVSISKQAQGTVRDSVFWANTAVKGPSLSAAGTTLPSVLTVDHCDVDGGQAGVHVATGHVLNWGAGNLAVDPLFVDLAARDLHLNAISPCRDAGAAPWSKDAEGDAQLGAPDIGADEFAPHAYTTGVASPGQSIVVKVLGTPGSTPVLELYGFTQLVPPLATPFGLLHAGPLYLGGAPISLPAIPADGVVAYAVGVPAATPVGLTVYRQILLGPPDSKFTNLDTITIVP